jgi:hypothetical protein
MEVFEILIEKQTDPVMYLLTDSRGNLMVEGFYEQELHFAIHSDVQGIKSKCEDYHSVIPHLLIGRDL